MPSDRSRMPIGMTMPIASFFDLGVSAVAPVCARTAGKAPSKAESKVGHIRRCELVMTGLIARVSGSLGVSTCLSSLLMQLAVLEYSELLRT